MGLAQDWDRLEQGLQPDWSSAQVELSVAEGDAGRTAALLAPAQPLHTGATTLRFSLAHDGTAMSPGAVRRLLAHLEQEGVAGSLALVSSDIAPAPVRAHAQASLVASWETALATLPADWSDLAAEVELGSSDYLDLAALQLAPINPRRVPPGSRLRFRCAARFGYGASPGMVRRCLERCDEHGIRGAVEIVRVLCDTRPVATQGPVWQMGGQTV